METYVVICFKSKLLSNSSSNNNNNNNNNNNSNSKIYFLNNVLTNFLK